jgi:hypothetical protein
MDQPFAVFPDGHDQPTAVFLDIEDAIDWALARYGADRFAIRCCPLTLVEEGAGCLAAS